MMMMMMTMMMMMVTFRYLRSCHHVYFEPLTWLYALSKTTDMAANRSMAGVITGVL